MSDDILAARQRAQTRLAQLHPEEFRELFEAERLSEAIDQTMVVMEEEEWGLGE